MMMATMQGNEVFQFKQFSIQQDQCTMKVGTDGVLLGCWAALKTATTVLDIGTGTGVIALIVAQRQPHATVTGIDIDAAAAQQAQHNAEASPFGARVHITPMALQDFGAQHDATFDLIITNPPFFTGGVLSVNQDKNSVRHTIKLPHSDLLRNVKKLLAPSGKFCVILPVIEGLRFVELAATYSLYCTRQVEVFPTPTKPASRLLLEFQKSPALITCTTLTLLDADGKATADYKALTEDFYL